MTELPKDSKALATAAALLLAFLSLAALSACGTTNAASSATAEGADEGAVHPVRVAEATAGDVREFITRVTTISAPDTVEVLPRIGGQIVELLVEEGQRVSAGQLIARLDDTQLRLTEERARAERDKLRYDCEQARRKLDYDIIGEEEYLEALHRYQQAEHDLQRAVFEREKTEIEAPIDGIVCRRHVSLGDTVFTTAPLVTIVDPGRLEAEVLVPQDQIDRVALGNPVVLSIGGDSGRSVSGVVERISPIVETDSGTVRVAVAIPAGQQGILPGVFVRANIITGVQTGVTLVPREAILIENAMSVIYKVIDGIARRIPVEVGFPGAGGIQVRGDIEPGDSVIVAGARGLDDMTRVRVLASSASS